MDNTTILIIALCGLIMAIGVTIKQMYHCKSGCFESDCVKPSSRKPTLTAEESAIVNLQSQIQSEMFRQSISPPNPTRTSSPIPALTINDDIYANIVRSSPINIPQSPNPRRKSEIIHINKVPYKTYSTQTLYVNDSSLAERQRTISDPTNIGNCTKADNIEV